MPESLTLPSFCPTTVAAVMVVLTLLHLSAVLMSSPLLSPEAVEKYEGSWAVSFADFLAKKQRGIVADVVKGPVKLFGNRC